MKGKFLAVLALAGVAGMSSAQESERDSARVAELSEVVASSVADFKVGKYTFEVGGEEQEAKAETRCR